MRCMIGLPQGTWDRGSQSTDGVHGERHQSDADAAAAVCEQRTCETCVRAWYCTIYGRHDIVRSTNLRSISRYRVIDMITNGDSAPLQKKGTELPIFGPSLLLPKGWMHQDATWYGLWR